MNNVKDICMEYIVLIDMDESWYIFFSFLCLVAGVGTGHEGALASSLGRGSNLTILALPVLGELVHEDVGVVESLELRRDVQKKPPPRERDTEREREAIVNTNQRHQNTAHRNGANGPKYVN